MKVVVVKEESTYRTRECSTVGEMVYTVAEEVAELVEEGYSLVDDSTVYGSAGVSITLEKFKPGHATDLVAVVTAGW